MTIIEIKGDVVDNATASFYNFFGIKSANPQAVSDAIKADADGELVLQIASNGGDVFAASEIYTMLKQYEGHITVEVQGMAASAASVIAMAGDTIKMSPTAMMMIHKAWTGVSGNADDMAHEAKVMENIDKSIATTYVTRTGMDEGDVMNLMAQETWMTAKDAVDRGFADEVMFVDEHTPQIAASAGTIVPRSAVNKLLNLLNEAKPEPQSKPINTLRQRKLAILLSEKED